MKHHLNVVYMLIPVTSKALFDVRLESLFSLGSEQVTSERSSVKSKLSIKVQK